MKNRKRFQLAALVAGLGAVVAATGLTGSTAYADTLSEMVGISYQTNASDPFVTTCTDTIYGQKPGFCLYTSRDLAYKSIYPSGFNMNGTRQFFSEDGLTWEDRGLAIDESWYSSWVTNDKTFHLWAPAMAVNMEGDPTPSPIYYLYVPDVTDPTTVAGQNTSSRIGVSRSTAGPFGPFIYVDYVKGGNLLPSLAKKGYMSDPEVFPAQPDGTQRYLLWANGTGGNCGTLSIAPLNNDMTTLDVSGKKTAEDFQIKIDGLEVLGGADPKCNGQPYLEGPSLFDFRKFSLYKDHHARLPTNYTLIFPVGLGNVPAECSMLGQTNNKNQAIVYATSDKIDGTYVYGGVLMCGSSTTLTNQATIFEAKTAWGSPRLVMIFHDAANSSPLSRKIHAECLMPKADGGIWTADHTPDGVDWCMTVHHIVALRALSNSKYVAADDMDHGKGLHATRDRIGPWEQFNLIHVGTDKDGNETVALQARSTGRYVSADKNNGNYRLVADRVVRDTWEVFSIVPGNGFINLKAWNGSFVTAEQRGDSSNKDWLVADRIKADTWEQFQLIDLYAD